MATLDQIKIGGTTYDFPSSGGNGSTDIIVAASDSTELKKSVADYVCDGTNDEAELQAAIDTALSNGRSVKLMKGTYYIDVASKNYNGGTNNAFLLINTTGYKGIKVYGEDAFNRPTIRLSDSCYEGLAANTQYSILAVGDDGDYSGTVELYNLRISTPSNQKKIVALDLLAYGGFARLHSIGINGFISGYNGVTITLLNPPAVAVEGSIGIRFIGKGPNGTYGSEITDTTIQGLYEGISINTEWTICTHTGSIWCVYGWTFGHYAPASYTAKSSTHPIVLLNCADERNINLPKFYKPVHHLNGTAGEPAWKQDIEMIAFSIERAAGSTPGGVLGKLAEEEVPGSYRGMINYCTGQGSGNKPNIGFWEYGHGHGIRTTDMTHKTAGTTSERNSYRCNYMQQFFDTDENKLLFCVDEQYKTWKDANGNVVSNS